MPGHRRSCQTCTVRMRAAPHRRMLLVEVTVLPLRAAWGQDTQCCMCYTAGMSDGKMRRDCASRAGRKPDTIVWSCPACTEQKHARTCCPVLHRSPARNNQTVPPAAARLEASNPHLKYHDNYKVMHLYLSPAVHTLQTTHACAPATPALEAADVRSDHHQILSHTGM
jgi:hypothetical protein